MLRSILMTLFILAGCSMVPVAADPSTETKLPPRALFVSVIDKTQTLCSATEIEDLVSFAKKARIKTLFVQVYRSNQSWFPSRIADQSPYLKCSRSVRQDPLALLIKLAHAEQIEVHAWMNLLSLGVDFETPIFKKYGLNILTRDAKPKMKIQDFKIDGQYFLEPGDLRVREELEGIVAELLREYPALDGIQFDYIRYPDVHPIYGYSLMNTERFKKETGIKKIRDNDPAWQNWKRAQVTDLLKGAVRKARAVRPGIHVSTTGCMSYARAYHEAFQDWPGWVNSGLVEFVTIMSYADTLDGFEKSIDDVKERVSDLTKIKIGIGAYKLVSSPDVFIKVMDSCEKAKGGACTIFHYGSVLQSPAMNEYLITPPPEPVKIKKKAPRLMHN